MKKKNTPSLHWVIPEKNKTGGGVEDMEFPGGIYILKK